MQTNPQQHTQDSDSSKKWYREFWAWFVLTPLIVVVIVSSYTVSLAISNADDRVIDNYYKEGRMINMRIDEDLAAARSNLRALIVFDSEIDELAITLENDSSTFPPAITLELSHPSDQGLDHSIVLHHIAQGRYQAELSRDLNYRWYLRLLPVSKLKVEADAEAKAAEQLWRLRGEIDFSESQSVQLSAEI